MSPLNVGLPLRTSQVTRTCRHLHPPGREVKIPLRADFWCDIFMSLPTPQRIRCDMYVFRPNVKQNGLPLSLRLFHEYKLND